MGNVGERASSSRRPRSAAICLYAILALGLPLIAHETDQYTLPVGREFADLRYYFSEQFREALEDAIERVNARIDRSMRDGRPGRQTTHLQSPDTIASEVHFQFPWVVIHVEVLEAQLRSWATMQRYPGLITAYQPWPSIYDHWAIALDPTKLLRVRRSSTTMIDGVYLGTDKIVHFVHMGYLYYHYYRGFRARGVSESEAIQQVLAVGAGNHPLSERGLLGKVGTGVLSNADLASNYAGMKFYRNLTEPVTLRGVDRPPLLVRDGPHWRLNDQVANGVEFFSSFVSDHWDEALNPGVVDFHLQLWLPAQIKSRCDALLRWHARRCDATDGKNYFTALAEELTKYFGEDYGHDGNPDELFTIARMCFADADENPTDAEFAERPPALAAKSAGVHRVVLPADRMSVDVYERTALWRAVESGDMERVAELLRMGADPDRADVDEETPLHCAARWRRSGAGDMLLAAGANPNARSRFGSTPLHLAARAGALLLVKQLISHGADVNASDVFGCAALHDAAQRGDSRVIASLLQAGADVQARDVHGTTPLHRAARAGHANIVRRLLAAGADRAAANKLGRTPSDEASRCGHRDIRHILSDKP